MWYNDEKRGHPTKNDFGVVEGHPLILEPIIRQGIEEKVFTTRLPRASRRNHHRYWP